MTTLGTKGQKVPANSKAWSAPLHLNFRKEIVGSKNKHLGIRWSLPTFKFRSPP